MPRQLPSISIHVFKAYSNAISANSIAFPRSGIQKKKWQFFHVVRREKERKEEKKGRKRREKRRKEEKKGRKEREKEEERKREARGKEGGSNVECDIFVEAIYEEIKFA